MGCLIAEVSNPKFPYQSFGTFKKITIFANETKRIYVMTATLIIKSTGEKIKVHSTTSSYGKAVWVDEQGNAYLQVGSTNPLYDIVIDEPYATRLRIGNELAQHRRDKGLSVRQLAELAGVSKSTVVNIEAGRFSPTIDVTNKLLTALGAQLVIP